MRYTNRTLLITGAAAGLGRHIACAYAAEGADVAILDHQGAEATVAEITAMGRRARAFRADIRDEAAVADAVGAAHGWLGRIDVLVNNAGFNGHYALIKDMALSHWKETLDINLTGTFLVTRAVIPHMIAAGKGAIASTASNVARRGLPYRGDYVCSKWALLGLTQTLALELAPLGIRVNAVCPGPIEGDRIEDVMERQAAIEGKTKDQIRHDWEAAAPMNRFVTAQEVTSALMYLTSDDASAMTGQALNVTAGFLMT